MILQKSRAFLQNRTTRNVATKIALVATGAALALGATAIFSGGASDVRAKSDQHSLTAAEAERTEALRESLLQQSEDLNKEADRALIVHTRYANFLDTADVNHDVTFQVKTVALGKITSAYRQAGKLVQAADGPSLSEGEHLTKRAADLEEQLISMQSKLTTTYAGADGLEKLHGDIEEYREARRAAALIRESLDESVEKGAGLQQREALTKDYREARAFVDELFFSLP